MRALLPALSIAQVCGLLLADRSAVGLPAALLLGAFCLALGLGCRNRRARVLAAIGLAVASGSAGLAARSCGPLLSTAAPPAATDTSSPRRSCTGDIHSHVDSVTPVPVSSFSSFFFNIFYFVTFVKGFAIKSGYVYENVFSGVIIGDESVTF